MHPQKSLNQGTFPLRITLELTNRCNLACIFCPRKYMKDPLGDLDVDLAKKIIDEAAGHTPMQVVPFFRGEPLLHPRWRDILTQMKRRDLGEIQFTTNATQLTPEASTAILDTGLDFISFSMDTVDPQIYNHTRKGADYETCLGNILHFLSEKQRRGSKTVVQVSAVETDQHKQGMEHFVAFWRNRVDRVRIYAEHSTNGNPGSLSQPMAALAQRRPCHKLFSDMVICWNGEVAVCNHDWTRLTSGQHIANVTQTSVAEAWNSTAYNQLRRKHLEGDYAGTTVCEACDQWKIPYVETGLLGRLYTRDEQSERSPD